MTTPAGVLRHRTQVVELRGSHIIWAIEASGNFVFWAFDPDHVVEDSLFPQQNTNGSQFGHYRHRDGDWLYYDRAGAPAFAVGFDPANITPPKPSNLIDVGAFRERSASPSPNFFNPNAGNGGFLFAHCCFTAYAPALPANAINVQTRFRYLVGVNDGTGGRFTGAGLRGDGWSTWFPGHEYVLADNQDDLVISTEAGSDITLVLQGQLANFSMSFAGQYPSGSPAGFAFQALHSVDGASGFRSRLLKVKGVTRLYDVFDSAPTAIVNVTPTTAKCHPLVRADMRKSFKGSAPTDKTHQIIGLHRPNVGLNRGYEVALDLHASSTTENAAGTAGRPGSSFGGGGFLPPGYEVTYLDHHLMGRYGAPVVQEAQISFPGPGEAAASNGLVARFPQAVGAVTSITFTFAVPRTFITYALRDGVGSPLQASEGAINSDVAVTTKTFTNPQGTDSFILGYFQQPAHQLDPETIVSVTRTFAGTGDTHAAGRLKISRNYEDFHVNFSHGDVGLGHYDSDLDFEIEWPDVDDPFSVATLVDGTDPRIEIYSQGPGDIVIREAVSNEDQFAMIYGVQTTAIYHTGNVAAHLTGKYELDSSGLQYTTVPVDHVVHSDTRNYEPAFFDSVIMDSIHFTRFPMPLQESTDTESVEAWFIVEGLSGSASDLQILSSPSQRNTPYGVSSNLLPDGTLRIDIDQPQIGTSQAEAELGAPGAENPDSRANNAIGIGILVNNIFGNPISTTYTRATFYSRRVGNVGTDRDLNVDAFPLDAYAIDWGDSGGQEVATGTEVLTFRGATLPTPAAGILIPNLAAVEKSRSPQFSHVYDKPGTYQVFGLVKSREPAASATPPVAPSGLRHVVSSAPITAVVNGTAAAGQGISNVQPPLQGGSVPHYDVRGTTLRMGFKYLGSNASTNDETQTSVIPLMHMANDGVGATGVAYIAMNFLSCHLQLVNLTDPTDPTDYGVFPQFVNFKGWEQLGSGTFDSSGSNFAYDNASGELRFHPPFIGGTFRVSVSAEVGFIYHHPPGDPPSPYGYVEGGLYTFAGSPGFVLLFAFNVELGPRTAVVAPAEPAQASYAGPVTVTIQPCLEIGDAPPFIDPNSLKLKPRGDRVSFE